MTHMQYDDDPETVASFTGAPAGVPPMTVLTDKDETYGTVSVGVEIFHKNGMSVEAQYRGQFSDRTESHSGMLELSTPY